MDKAFTDKLQAWLNQSREDRDWDEGALMLLQLTGQQNHVSQPQCEP